MKPSDFKSDIKPIWCPGCGHHAVLAAITRALPRLEMAKEDITLISGIGCSSRIPAYVDTYGFHGVHGRALAVATGLKAARPDLTVLATGGDGDGFSIGGNHFLHACRRNMDLTYIVMDNEGYGMTKGQASPTTPPDWTKSKLTPHGTGIRPFKPLAVALAAGAGFIARGFSGDPTLLSWLLVEAIRHPGFSFVHVLSPCQTFHPEQWDWKRKVHPWEIKATDDPVTVAKYLHKDDGMSQGILYKAFLPVWRPHREPETSIARIEQEFLV